MKPYIRVEDVHKTYAQASTGEEVVALSGVNLDIYRGEFVSLVGPSGCGKSTLLRFISGLDAAGEGAIYVDDKKVVGPDPQRGMLFQEYALFPWKTVEENVAFGPKVRGKDKREYPEEVRSYIELVNLSGFEKKYPHELSGGMRQRCALARLLANNPDLLLMDEPLAAIDAQTRLILQQEILNIWTAEKKVGREKTVIWVTHSIEEAVFVSDRIMVMTGRPGRIREIITVPLDRPRTDKTTTDQQI